MNPQDLTAFNRAVAFANSGNKAQAYQILVGLQSRYPANKDVLLWLAFTTPSFHEAERAVYDAGRASPQDPGVISAQNWLAAERLKREETRPVYQPPPPPQPTRKRALPFWSIGIAGAAVVLIVAALVWLLLLGNKQDIAPDVPESAYQQVSDPGLAWQIYKPGDRIKFNYQYNGDAQLNLSFVNSSGNRDNRDGFPWYNSLSDNHAVFLTFWGNSHLNQGQNTVYAKVTDHDVHWLVVVAEKIK